MKAAPLVENQPSEEQIKRDLHHRCFPGVPFEDTSSGIAELKKRARAEQVKTFKLTFAIAGAMILAGTILAIVISCVIQGICKDGWRFVFAFTISTAIVGFGGWGANHCIRTYVEQKNSKQ